MAIEVTLRFEDDDEPTSAEDLKLIYEQAKKDQIEEQTLNSLNAKHDKVIKAISDNTGNTVTLNASARKFAIRTLIQYEFSEREKQAEHKRLNK